MAFGVKRSRKPFNRGENPDSMAEDCCAIKEGRAGQSELQRGGREKKSEPRTRS